MRRLFIAALAVALGFIAGAHAQTGGNGKPSSTFAAPLGFCQFTASSSAQTLANVTPSSGTVSTPPARAAYALICVETASVRFRDDGTAPTASIGFPLTPPSSQIFCIGYQSNLNAIQFIAQSGSPVVDISFYDAVPGLP